MSALNTSPLSFIQKKEEIKKSFLAVVHSKPGVGKSTFASQCKTGLYFDLENSAEYLTFMNYVAPKSFDEFLGQLDQVGRAIATKELSIETIDTIFIDTITGLLAMVTPDAIAMANAQEGLKNTEAAQFKYGIEKYQRVFIGRMLARIKRFRELGVSTFLLAHSVIEKSKDPLAQDPFDFYNILCPKTILADIVEASGMIFYADSPIVTFGSKGNKKARADGDMNLLRCGISPAYLSKNRIGIDDEIDLDYNSFCKEFLCAHDRLANNNNQ